MTKEKFITIIRAWIKYINTMDKIGDILGVNLCDTTTDTHLNYIFEQHFSDYSKEIQDLIFDFIYEHCITKEGIFVDSPIPLKLYDAETKEEICSINSLDDLYDYIQTNLD